MFCGFCRCCRPRCNWGCGCGCRGAGRGFDEGIGFGGLGGFEGAGFGGGLGGGGFGHVNNQSESLYEEDRVIKIKEKRNRDSCRNGCW